MSEPSGLRFLGGDRSYAFLRRLPWRSRAVLLTAVFFTFASMGFLQHMWKLEASPSWTRMGLVVAFNGLLDLVERDGQIVMCVADVSGHGVAAGSFMGMTKSAFRMRLLSPAPLDTVLDDLDEVVTTLRSPGMFMTFAGIRFDGSATAEIALAGHLPVLHWRTATATIHSIDNRCPPLGVVAGQRHASEHVEFAPGDLFVVLTDGLTEVNDRSQQEFGMTGIMQTLERHAHEPLPKLYSALLAAARAHGPQTDDQTLLLIRAR